MRERSRLIASDSSRMDDFGRALAVDGNTLIVGAPRKRDGTGVAYAFERASADADWRQTGIIEPPADVDAREYAAALAPSSPSPDSPAPSVSKLPKQAAPVFPSRQPPHPDSSSRVADRSPPTTALSTCAPE